MRLRTDLRRIWGFYEIITGLCKHLDNSMTISGQGYVNTRPVQRFYPNIFMLIPENELQYLYKVISIPVQRYVNTLRHCSSLFQLERSYTDYKSSIFIFIRSFLGCEWDADLFNKLTTLKPTLRLYYPKMANHEVTWFFK